MITVATRLMQIHLCIIYLFGGIAKLRGEMWWDGSAMWFSAVAYEYQSLDLTWIGRYPFLGSLLTHITIFWETFYGFLVWPRWSRPWMLALAVLVHGGIALFLGMITFGFMMIVANLAFVEPRWIEAWLKRFLTMKRFMNPMQGYTMGFWSILALAVWFYICPLQAEESPSQSKSKPPFDESMARALFLRHHDGWSLDEVMLRDDRRKVLTDAYKKRSCHARGKTSLGDAGSVT